MSLVLTERTPERPIWRSDLRSEHDDRPDSRSDARDAAARPLARAACASSQLGWSQLGLALAVALVTTLWLEPFKGERLGAVKR
jgi:hypothetical protein